MQTLELKDIGLQELQIEYQRDINGGLPILLPNYRNITNVIHGGVDFIWGLFDGFVGNP